MSGLRKLLTKLSVVLTSAMLLTGCGTLLAGVAPNECRVFAAPTFAVQGLRRIDRRWIDGEIERGIAACGWQRPTTKDPALQIEPKAKPS